MFDDGVGALLREWCAAAAQAGGAVPVTPALDARATQLLDAALSLGDPTDLLVALERLSGWVAAAQAEVMTRIALDHLDGRDGEAEVKPQAADQIACALRVSSQTAQRRMGLAWDLSQQLPATLGQLGAGRITPAKANVISAETCHLGDAHRAAVEAKVLVRAADQTPGQLRHYVRRVVQSVDPAVTDKREAVARNNRDVRFWPTEDGLAQLQATLTVDDAARVYAHLDAAAQVTATGDVRPVGVRRADALVDLVTGQGVPTTAVLVQATVPADVLAGTSEEPGEIAGIGPVSAQAIRRLVRAGDARIRFVLTDPATGRLRATSRQTYRPSAELERQVRLRDGTCRFPGCRQPAKRCDIDHQVPWPNGDTDAHNLACLCRYHHQLKQRDGWRVWHDPDGTLTWTAPTGHRYVTRPAVLHHPPPADERRSAA